jgi:phage/plasmid-associated DNA primase
VYKELRRVLDVTYQDISDAKEHAIIAGKLLKLRSWKARSGIVSSIKAKIQVRIDPFDMNPNLIGFKNGVYDLEAGFREGKFNDYVSKAVSYEFNEVSEASTTHGLHL